MTVAVCMASGKHRYPTWSAAVGPAVRSTQRAGRPMRIYRCPDCAGYHLTKRIKWEAATG